MDLLTAYRSAKYQIMGHGPREISALHDAVEFAEGRYQKADIYGSGLVIEDFERKIATLCGKEAGIFFPSGTMAQQIALRIWCDRKGVKRVAYHPLCHLEIHEEDGIKELHGIEAILLGEQGRLITLADVKAIEEPYSTILIELPQREIGGQLPDWDELVAITAYCRDHGIATHLDGARLWEAVPYYGKNEKEICALFDTVYVSFYKGIGGIAGAMLLCSESFRAQAKVWKRRHGGDVISLHPYILNAWSNFDRRHGNMQRYWDSAKVVAALLNQSDLLCTQPEVPQTNMFHLYFQTDRANVEKAAIEVAQKFGIGLIANLRVKEDGQLFSEISLGDSIARIPEGKLEEAILSFNEIVSESV
jgi:threonine aldolase